MVLSHPAVAECAVIGVPDERWGEAVKAVVVLKPGRSATEAYILAHCGGQLAGFKKPKSVSLGSELPRNPTGKILRRALREPYWQGRSRTIG